MVSRWRFELQTLWLKVKCSTDWASGTNFVVASARFELAHATVKVWCLTAWLRGNSNQTNWWREMDLNHRTRRNRFTVCRVWPLRYPSIKMVPEIGLEPTTYWLQVSCSTNWAIPAKKMVGDIGLEPMTPCL